MQQMLPAVANKTFGSVQISHNASAHLGDQYYYGPTYHVNHISVEAAISNINDKVADWLASANYIDVQNDIQAHVLPGSNLHFFQSQDYVEWLQGPGHNVILNGIPGSGKTYLSAMVVDDLRTRYDGQLNEIVLFQHNSFKRQNEQTATAMFRSLLRQAFCYRPDVDTGVLNMFHSHQTISRNSKPSLSEGLICLRLILRSYDRIFVVIDALDECVSGNEDQFGQRNMFLKELAILQKDLFPRISIFMTTRSTKGIPDLKATHITFRASWQDVAAYVASRLENSNKQMFQRADLCIKVQEATRRASEGMFLWARLQMDLIVQQSKPKAVLQILENTVPARDTLQAAYFETFSRIKEGSQNKLAGRTLSCLAFSKEPLTVKALLHAIAIEEGMDAVVENDLDDVQDVLNACAGLVTADIASGTIQLVHQTAQMFFDTLDDAWFSTYRTFLTKACLLYLSLPDVDEKAETLLSTSSDFAVSILSQDYPFLSYAMQHWLDHLHNDTEKRFWPLALRYLWRGCTVQLTFNAQESADNSNIPNAQDLIYLGHGVRWMHLLAFLGADFLCDFIVGDPMGSGNVSSAGNLEELFALEMKWQGFSRSSDDMGNTTIVYAAANGNIALLDKILFYSDDTGSSWQNTIERSILVALQFKKEMAAEWLLEQNFRKLNFNPKTYRPMMILAMRQGLCKPLQQLLNLQSGGLRPLRGSLLSCLEEASWGTDEALDLVLDYCYLEDNSELCRVVEAYSASNQDHASRAPQVVEHLIARRPGRTNLESTNGTTILFEACNTLNLLVIDCLCDSPHANFKMVNEARFTPLMVFINNFMRKKSAHETEVMFLFPKLCMRSDINHQSTRSGMTALHIVAGWKTRYRKKPWVTHRSAMLEKTLRESGADTTLKDHKSRTLFGIKSVGLDPEEMNERTYVLLDDSDTESDEDEVVIGSQRASGVRLGLSSGIRLLTTTSVATSKNQG